MAILTPSQLTSASNAVYFNNTSGSITPTTVRDLNTDWISSSILVSQTSSLTVLSASYAGTASVLLGSIVSSSYSLSGSYAGTASVLLGSIQSASYALSSSFAGTASYVASVASSSNAVTSSYAISSSQAATASYYGGAVVSASYAGTASVLLGSVVSASYALSSSFAVSASQAATASYYGGTIASASYAVSSSNAQTASYALNAGTSIDTSSFATTGSNTFVGNQKITGSINISGSINMVNGADLVTHHVKAAGSNGVEIQNNSAGVVGLFGAGGSLGTTFYGQVSATAFVGSGSGVVGVVTSSYSVSSSQAANATLFNSLSSSQFAQLVANNTFTGNNVFGNVTASNALITSASVINLTVVYETASVIYSSGSNQFGDAVNDTQTLYGTVVIPTGSFNLNGSAVINTGSLSVYNNAIKVEAAEDNSGAPLTLFSMTGFSGSSLVNYLAQTGEGYEIATLGGSGTIFSDFDAVVYTSSAWMVVPSNATQTNPQVEFPRGTKVTGSLNVSGTFSVANAGGTDFQVTNTGTFIGNAITDVHSTTGSFSITGSSTFSGSVNGQVISASVSSNTSSLNFGTANFFTSAVTGSTFFNITNPKAGETVNVLLTTVGVATASFSSNVKQVSGSAYTPTSGSGKNDVLTFISFDGTSVYLANVKNLI